MAFQRRKPAAIGGSTNPGNRAFTAALLRRVLENRDLAVELPQLDIVTVSELESLFFRSMVIGAKQIERHHDMAVVSDDIRAILAHADTA